MKKNRTEKEGLQATGRGENEGMPKKAIASISWAGNGGDPKETSRRKGTTRARVPVLSGSVRRNARVPHYQVSARGGGNIGGKGGGWEGVHRRRTRSPARPPPGPRAFQKKECRKRRPGKLGVSGTACRKAPGWECAELKASSSFPPCRQSKKRSLKHSEGADVARGESSGSIANPGRSLERSRPKILGQESSGRLRESAPSPPTSTPLSQARPDPGFA